MLLDQALNIYLTGWTRSLFVYNPLTEKPGSGLREAKIRKRNHLPPECFIGSEHSLKRIDQWSFGVFVVSIFTCRHPFFPNEMHIIDFEQQWKRFKSKHSSHFEPKLLLVLDGFFVNAENKRCLLVDLLMLDMFNKSNSESSSIKRENVKEMNEKNQESSTQYVDFQIEAWSIKAEPVGEHTDIAKSSSVLPKTGEIKSCNRSIELKGSKIDDIIKNMKSLTKIEKMGTRPLDQYEKTISLSVSERKSEIKNAPNRLAEVRKFQMDSCSKRNLFNKSHYIKKIPIDKIKFKSLISTACSVQTNKQTKAVADGPDVRKVDPKVPLKDEPLGSKVEIEFPLNTKIDPNVSKSKLQETNLNFKEKSKVHKNEETTKKTATDLKTPPKKDDQNIHKDLIKIEKIDEVSKTKEFKQENKDNCERNKSTSSTRKSSGPAPKFVCNPDEHKAYKNLGYDGIQIRSSSSTKKIIKTISMEKTGRSGTIKMKVLEYLNKFPEKQVKSRVDIHKSMYPNINYKIMDF